MGRFPSTISRELARNGWRDPARSPARRGHPPVAGCYRVRTAQRSASRLAQSPRRTPKLVVGTWLWERVVNLLASGHSPEQVSEILARMHPDASHARVSHETIYTALHTLPRGSLRRELIGYLRQARKRRRPRSRGVDRRGQIPNMVSIHVRPPEADERVIPGHWERTTLFVSLAKVDNASAQAVVAGFSKVLNRIGVQRRLSLTYDQGKEMASHEQLSDNVDVSVYFADPHNPWQLGINENINGLLREYLPKGADLSAFSPDELDAIAWRLNARPSG